MTATKIVREIEREMESMGFRVVERFAGGRHFRLRVRGPNGRERWISLPLGSKMNPKLKLMVRTDLRAVLR